MAKGIEPKDFVIKALKNFAEAYKIATDQLKNPKIKSFKIGKSADHPNERIKSDDYKGYSQAVVLKKSKSAAHIDLLEKDLISAYIYTSKCRNMQIGSGINMTDIESEWYYVYMMLKF